VLIVFCSLVQMDARFGGSPPAVAVIVDRLIEPLHIVSGYGLFAVMTTERDEIVIEGSYDGVEWRDYEFRYKPGDVSRRPPWNIPHQPRLDWQMWFAALDDPRRLRWFPGFLQRVLENAPPVMALMEKNPFPDRPPVYVRAQFYAYTYSSSEEKARGVWWDRRLLGLYFPEAHLKGE
jgi:lipase maturation factor 1